MALNFLRELRRRRVLRTASIYVVGAWLLMQVADVVFPALDIPETAMRNLLYALTAGFPLALIAGWYFDITKDGIRLTRSTDKELPPLILEDYAMLAVIVFVSGVIAFTLWPESESDISIEGAVAVLPFEDLEEGSEIGRSFSAEIVSALKRVPGIWVPGLDSSTHFKDADPVTIGKELGVGAVLSGTVHRDGDGIEISAEIRGAKTGKHILSLTSIVDAGDLLQAQREIVDATLAEIAPTATERSGGLQKSHQDACAPVYDVYLRARQIAETPGSRAFEIRARAVDMLQQATTDAPDCVLAWSGLANAHYNMAPQFEGAEAFERGLVPAGLAARRALELDDTIAEPWIILAEIAEQDGRLIDAENYFLKALFAEPTHALANAMYGETLLARGRVQDGLHYALEGYRQDPASRNTAFKVALAAKMAGDADMAIEFGNIHRDLSQQAAYNGFAEIARGHMLNGDIDAALAEYRANSDWMPEWFPECVEAQRDPSRIPAVKQILSSSEVNENLKSWTGWWVVVCGTWLGEADLVLGWVFGEDARREITEGLYIMFFFSEASALRQHPRFRQFVEEEGLLDYWRAVGWSDYCEADGDSFRCR
jgi:TolB-like protein